MHHWNKDGAPNYISIALYPFWHATICLSAFWCSLLFRSSFSRPTSFFSLSLSASSPHCVSRTYDRLFSFFARRPGAIVPSSYSAADSEICEHLHPQTLFCCSPSARLSAVATSSVAEWLLVVGLESSYTSSWGNSRSLGREEKTNGRYDPDISARPFFSENRDVSLMNPTAISNTQNMLTKSI